MVATQASVYLLNAMVRGSGPAIVIVSDSPMFISHSVFLDNSAPIIISLTVLEINFVIICIVHT